jgi:pantetheine-phosphate adenylyltransferase
LYRFLSEGGITLTVAIYPGSFDPITFGHIDIAARAANLFDKLVIGIYDTPRDKAVLFSTAERVELARAATSHLANVEVLAYSGLTGDFARTLDARVMVRGLRVNGDFEREFTLTMMNKKFFPELEQICLMSSAEYQFVSSSLLKDMAALGGKIEQLVPQNVATALRKKLGKKR